MKVIPLSFSQKLSHYLLSLIMAGLAMIPIYFWLTGNTNTFLTDSKAIGSAIVFLSMAAFVFIKQRRALRFYTINCDVSINRKNQLIREILSEHHWKITKKGNRQIQAEGSGFRDSVDIRTW